MKKIKENDIVIWEPTQKVGLHKEKVGRVVSVHEDSVDVWRCSCMQLINLPISAVTVIGNIDDDEFLEDANNICNASCVHLQKRIQRLDIAEDTKNELLKILGRIVVYNDIIRLSEKQFCPDECTEDLSVS